MTIAEVQTEDTVAARMAAADILTDNFLAAVAATLPVIPECGTLAGPLRAEPGPAPGWWSSDNLHFPMDVRTLLKLGAPGIAAAARDNAAHLDGDRAHYLQCIARTYEGVASFITAHADTAEAQMAAATTAELHRLKTITETCRTLAGGPPQSFLQAVQLFWFVHALRGSHGVSATIGRLDQHLQPFYAADTAAGNLTRDDALESLCELWRGLNRMIDHPVMGLMNLIVGGQDAGGNDATNDVSYLILDTVIAVNDTNPFVSVRIHDRTPEAFVDKVVEVQMLGTGHATVYNDELIIPSLVRYGVPIELARNYANDGCNEVTIDGQSTISIYLVDGLKSLECALFNGRENPSARQEPRPSCRADEKPHDHIGLAETGFETGDFAQMTRFEEFLVAFTRQFDLQIAHKLHSQTEGLLEAATTGVSSPLMAGTFATVLATGNDPFRGGVELAEQMIFLATLGTVGDCLAAIKKVVFEDKACTPAELLEAIAADWDSFEPLRQRCLAAPKFGNDDDYVDSIVTGVVEKAAACVKRCPSASGQTIWPCLFGHSFLPVAQSCGATPDGRKWMDPVGEHFSPTPGRATSGPTAVIRSVTKSPLADCVGVAVFHVGLSRSMVPRNGAGRALLKHLIRSGLKMGVTQMNTAIYDVDTLRDAKAHPEKYPDLIVRVWGYSARFVSLATKMQDHIIARAIRG